MITKRSMMKSSEMAHKSPLLLTATGAKLWMREYRSHGAGRLLKRERDTNAQSCHMSVNQNLFFHQAFGAHPTVMLKMLVPIELDTAMSARPLRATIKLVTRSGAEVPTAKIVRPMISSGMPMVSPTYRRNPELRADRSYSFQQASVF